MTLSQRPPSSGSGPSWVADAVFYQIFPDRFAASARVAKPGPLEAWLAPPTAHGFKGGDLRGIAERLDYLTDLGATALYLTPVFASASNHRYHTFDYERVDPLLGGEEALRELLDAVHARGMRLVLDGVFNHVGRGFWAFHHILENGAASPYRDWFHLDPEVQAGRRHVHAYPGRAGQAVVSERTLGYRAWWGLPALPKLNHANPEVREHIYDVAQKWLSFGIDGWRLDVPEEISESGFWEEFRARCLAVRPDAYLVGEIWNPAPGWLGDRFDGLMNYPLAEAILSFTAGGSLDAALVGKVHEYVGRVRPMDGPEFGRELERVTSLYPRKLAELQLNLLGSHDTPRFRSLAGGHATAYLLASLIQMTLPGAPCIYYGDEIGLEGRDDPDCRRAYPWNEPGLIDEVLRSSIAGLIEFRKAEPATRHGSLTLLAAQGASIAYSISGPEPATRAVAVAVNSGKTPTRLTAPAGFLEGRPLEQASVALAPGSAGLDFRPIELSGSELTFDLPPRSGLLVRTRRS